MFIYPPKGVPQASQAVGKNVDMKLCFFLAPPPTKEKGSQGESVHTKQTEILQKLQSLNSSVLFFTNCGSSFFLL